MLRYFDNSFKSQLEKLRLDCDHFTESEDEISDRVEQGIIPPVSSENCNLTQTFSALICLTLQGRGQSAPGQPSQCRRSDPSLALKRVCPAPPSLAHPSPAEVSLPSTSASLARPSEVADKRRHPMSSPPGRRSRFTSRKTPTVTSTTTTMMPMTTTS